MCKVLAVAGIKKENTEKLWDFMVAVTPYMAQNDKDGVGYAAVSKEGIFGERWLFPKDAWKLRNKFTKKEEEIIKEYNGALKCDQRYNSFGKIGSYEDATAVVLHTRMATCAKGIENTHPFVSADGKTALIHNGVISNASRLTNLTSTCDSECILNEYKSFDVSNVPEAISLVAGKLEGYFACPVLTIDNNGNQYLDIFKETTARLVATYIPQLDAMVFCTNMDIIKSVCKDLKWKWRSFFTVEAGKMIRLNAVTGSVVGTYEFKADSYSRRWAGSSTANYSGIGWGERDMFAGSYQSVSKADEGKQVKSAAESAKTFKAAELTVLSSDDMPDDDLPLTRADIQTALDAGDITPEDFQRLLEEIEWREETANKLSKVMDVDADDATSPFHVKSGS
jgi:hypothetical protein